MNILVSLFLVIFSFPVLAKCRLVENTSIVSLAGSSTVLFRELGLLEELKGISVFNPVAESEYKGKVYPGGIFLSQSVLNDFKTSTVIFDESRELEKILKAKEIKRIELKSRNQSPSETIHATLKLIIPFTTGCDQEIEKIEQRRVFLENKILNLTDGKKKFLFFLGEMKEERLPEMIMSNDGVVKWLKDKQKIVTYPSDLAYVNWSSKILNDFRESKMVGLIDTARKNKKEIVKVNGKINVYFPGILVPGLSQLEGFAFLFESIK